MLWIEVPQGIELFVGFFQLAGKTEQLGQQITRGFVVGSRTDGQLGLGNRLVQLSRAKWSDADMICLAEC